jgi:N-acetylglucosaminyldiphosphoundecaprenol N-acetyl-beta-D-mannosaminyltransferase
MSTSKVHLFGREFMSADSVEEVAELVVQRTAQRTGNEFLVTPNAIVIVTYAEQRYHYIRDFYADATYILPDGMPLVWLSKLKGRPLKSRLTGSDLFPAMWTRIKAERIAATLILPSQEMADKFQQEYEACNCIVPEFFDADDKEYIRSLVDTASKRIMENRSDYIFLGLSFPKQEILAMEISKKLEELKFEKGVLFLLLGASYEFYFGSKKRAPDMYRKTGMEWLYRFIQEPGRLWKRYTIGNTKFIGLAIKELLKK